MSHPYQPPQTSPMDGGQPAYGPPPGQPAYGMPPAGFPQYGEQPPAPRKGSGLAIAALVLGIIALVLCWVPIVNNFAAVLAVVGLALGIPALVSARRGKRTGRGMALASVILSVVAIVGVLATQALYSSVLDDVSDEINNSIESADASAGAEAEVAANDEADASAAADAVLPLGKSGQLSEYTVTVDSVTQDANDVVANENQFNGPPNGQYVLVGLTVTYNGTDDGDPWIDLSTEFVGTDARKYDTSSCTAVIPNEASDVPTLLTGGTASYQVCMDVPPTAIAGGKVEVSESFSFDDSKLVWAIQ
jgi:hypothetical protein